jgi:radical SAM-linked protein
MTDQSLAYPLLIRFAKAGLMRFVGHLDWQTMQHAMFLRAGFPLAQGEGPTHRHKIKTSPPTPVGVASFTELAYIQLSETLYPDEAQRRLSAHCPMGVEVLAAKDAGFLVRKNPFGTIEAAGYSLDLGDTTPEETAKTFDLLTSMKSDPVPDSVDPDTVKPFWGRIVELNIEKNKISLLADQREAFTFHGAKCATYLQETLDLPHYPLFTKEDYYRLKPSRRKLFR